MKIRGGMRTTCAAILAVAGATGSSLGLQATDFNRPSEPLKAYLRSYLSVGGKIAPDKTTRIAVFSLKTNGEESEEDIVYVSGQGWCGSGGCTMLILQATKSAFKVLGRVTIVQLPVRLLPSLSYGHPDIGVSVHGGGILSKYEAVLSSTERPTPPTPLYRPRGKPPECEEK
jgi:hypothetical protein